MHDLHIASVIAVDAPSVVLEGLRYCYTAGNGTSLGDLLHHVLLTSDRAVLIDTVD